MIGKIENHNRNFRNAENSDNSVYWYMLRTSNIWLSDALILIHVHTKQSIRFLLFVSQYKMKPLKIEEHLLTDHLIKMY